jgi:beta-lactamase regulating signal transducer with metallopeptidase domain
MTAGMSTAGTYSLATLNDTVQSLADWAWRASWQGALLALVVAAIVLLARKKLSPACRFWLWSLVLLRLAVPTFVDVPWWKYLHTQPQPPERPRVTLATPAPILVNRPPAPAVVQDPESAVRGLGGPGTGRLPPRGERATLKARALKTLPWLWLTGAALIAVRIVVASIRLSRAVSRMPLIDDPDTLALLRNCCNTMRIRRAPELRHLPAPAGPALVGFLRPRILLPTSTLDTLDREELRLILLHELAHVKRRDVLVNWIGTLISILHWFNPAAWLVLWRMRVEREMACDEMVLRAAQREPRHQPAGHAYAHTILKLLETLSTSAHSSAPPAGALRVGILEGREKAQIQRRLVMIARFDTGVRRWSVLGASLALILAAAALTGAVSAQDAGAPAGSQRKKPAAEQPAKRSYENPSLPKLSRHARALYEQMLQRPQPPNDEELLLFKDNLGQAYAQELIYVPGQAAPINQQQVGQKIQQDWDALQTWVQAAKRANTWNDPKPAGARQPGSPAGHGDPRGLSGEAFLGVADANDPASAKTREKLAKPIPANFAGTGLADVIDFLRDTTDVDILVDWKALEAAGIPRDTTVDLRLKTPTAADHVLTLVLRTAAPNMLTHHIDRGVVMVETAEQGHTTMVTKAYEVSDLLSQPVPGAEEAMMGRGGGGGGGRHGPGGYGGGGFESSQLSQLQALIMQTVQPSSWGGGGGQGTIGAFGTKLIIKNSDTAHKEVTDLLAMLRDKPAKKATERTDKAQQ